MSPRNRNGSKRPSRPLTLEELSFAVWSAKRRVSPEAQAARVELRARFPTLTRLCGETDEEWALGTQFAQATVAEYGHLYDDHGNLITAPVEPT